MPKFAHNDDGIEALANYLIKNLGDISKYENKGGNTISSLFLAGAPGAGKTEFLDTILSELKNSCVIIDIDQYRNFFRWYNGENSREYQNASVRVADKILKFCFKNNLNFVFDGTFRNYNKVKQNFAQCEKYGRNSLIVLIFQEPRLSFYYTFLRKLNKKRNVPIDVFVDGFYESIRNIFQIKKDFKNVEIMVAEKHYNLFAKNIYEYKIDYDTQNIYSFCERHRIEYKKWEFTNREQLLLDLQKFYSILEDEYINKKWNFFTKIKIATRELLYKFF